jgi:hypothetical protein
MLLALMVLLLLVLLLLRISFKSTPSPFPNA